MIFGMWKGYETKEARKDKKLILMSYPKAIQSKLLYFVNDILDNPRNLNTVGKPEQLKHKETETWSRELNRKDRIVYGIEPESKYNMPEEDEIVVFFQYLGYYMEK